MISRNKENNFIGSLIGGAADVTNTILGFRAQNDAQDAASEQLKTQAEMQRQQQRDASRQRLYDVKMGVFSSQENQKKLFIGAAIVLVLIVIVALTLDKGE